MPRYYHYSIVFLIVLLGCQPEKASQENDRKGRPNIILIAVDDLNDWVGVMGGHPQVQTPNIDKLASRGMLFTNAQCQAPVCNPSRASMMTSLYPSTTGIYFLDPDIIESEVAKRNRGDA